ncbi:hypothetical protein DICA3_A03180 [Diutina catenulata]
MTIDPSDLPVEIVHEIAGLLSPCHVLAWATAVHGNPAWAPLYRVITGCPLTIDAAVVPRYRVRYSFSDVALFLVHFPWISLRVWFDDGGDNASPDQQNHGVAVVALAEAIAGGHAPRAIEFCDHYGGDHALISESIKQVLTGVVFRHDPACPRLLEQLPALESVSLRNPPSASRDFSQTRLKVLKVHGTIASNYVSYRPVVSVTLPETLEELELCWCRATVRGRTPNLRKVYFHDVVVNWTPPSVATVENVHWVKVSSETPIKFDPVELTTDLPLPQTTRLRQLQVFHEGDFDGGSVPEGVQRLEVVATGAVDNLPESESVSIECPRGQAQYQLTGVKQFHLRCQEMPLVKGPDLTELTFVGAIRFVNIPDTLTSLSLETFCGFIPNFVQFDALKHLNLGWRGLQDSVSIHAPHLEDLKICGGTGWLWVRHAHTICAPGAWSVHLQTPSIVKSLKCRVNTGALTASYTMMSGLRNLDLTLPNHNVELEFPPSLEFLTLRGSIRENPLTMPDLRKLTRLKSVRFAGLCIEPGQKLPPSVHYLEYTYCVMAEVRLTWDGPALLECLVLNQCDQQQVFNEWSFASIGADCLPNLRLVHSFLPPKEGPVTRDMVCRLRKSSPYNNQWMTTAASPCGEWPEPVLEEVFRKCPAKFEVIGYDADLGEFKRSVMYRRPREKA